MCLHIVKCFQVLPFNADNLIKHQSFFYTLLNDQTVLLQDIQFSRSLLSTLSLNVKQFYFKQFSLACQQS